MPVEAIEARDRAARRVRTEAEPRRPGTTRRTITRREPRCVWSNRAVPLGKSGRAGRWLFGSAFEGYAPSRVLSRSGDLREAAASSSRPSRARRLGLERIDAEPVPESGLGVAIMDRLRASGAG